jgi:hypothetical protein
MGLFVCTCCFFSYYSEITQQNDLAKKIALSFFHWFTKRQYVIYKISIEWETGPDPIVNDLADFRLRKYLYGYRKQVEGKVIKV